MLCSIRLNNRTKTGTLYKTLCKKLMCKKIYTVKIETLLSKVIYF